MLRNAVRNLWSQPRAPEPPIRVWRDWLVLGVLVPTAILEATLRSDVIWRPVALVFALVVVITLMWRRTHPLAMVAISFGAFIVLDIAAQIGPNETVGLYTSAGVLLLPYALFRWGSGREAIIGLGIIAVSYLTTTVLNFTGLVDAVFGGLFLFLPAEIGASVRRRARGRIRELDQVKLGERQQLARELHDTVAHHVSAIAVQAQAGRTLAVADPQAAVQALEVIEAEASRTLAEMRTMVGVLRDGHEADLTPQRGVADIERLAPAAGTGPRLEVELSGEHQTLTPSLDAAIYRLAQESITNAVRHARHVSRIAVNVETDHERVTLTVRNDGDPVPARGVWGFGLVGMRERATLLGGTLEAGPTPGGGWIVTAVLPRAGSAS